MLRKVVFLTLLGVAAVLLAGPILAVLSALFSALAFVLAFAFLGLLIWLPFRIALAGKAAAFENVRDLGHGLVRVGARVPRTAARVVSAPLRLASRVIAAALRAAAALFGFAWVSVKVVLEIAFMAAVGFVLGGVGGYLLSRSPSLADGTLLLNALTGAALAGVAGGVLAVWSRLPKRSRQPVVA